MARGGIGTRALTVAALHACLGCAEPPSARLPGHLHLVDGAGRQVRVFGPARRIAALSPSNVEILFALGCGPSVVLRDRAADFPERVHSLPATAGVQLAAEHVAGYRPDLVLVSHLDAHRIAGLEALNIPVAVFDPQSVDAVLADIGAIGRLCGAEPRARALVETLRQRLEVVRRQVAGCKRIRLFVELDASDPLKPWTAGSASLVTDAVHLAGGVNVFADLPRSAVQVGLESMLRRSPEVVLRLGPRLASGASQRHSPASQGPALPAAGARTVGPSDPDLLSRPGPRLIAGIEALARDLHPDRFALGSLR